MESEIKAPTRMSKDELVEQLLALGYTEDDLKDGDGKKLKRPALIKKLNSDKEGAAALNALSAVEIEIDPPMVVSDGEDDIGVPISTTEDNNDFPVKIDGGPTQHTPRTTSLPLSHEPVSSMSSDTCESAPQEQEVPSPSDAGWTQYVLGKFLPDETDNKNPRVEGLRRVAGELVGEILEEGCDLVSPPSVDNDNRACVKAWAVFLREDGTTKRFEALADASPSNCMEGYATYLVAMADTRAKGRVFRNALLLRRVVSAEEVSKSMSTTEDLQGGGEIHQGQITVIRMLCNRMKISLQKLLDLLVIEYKTVEQSGEVNLKSVTCEDCLVVLKKLNDVRRKLQNGEEGIPEEIKEKA